VVNGLLTLWVEDGVSCHGVVKNTSLGDLLGLEALVLLQVLTVVISQVIVGDTTGETDSTTDQEIAHNSLKTRLSTLEVRASNE